MSKKVFIGVAWPYANADLHIGHLAGAYLAPDIFARYHRLAGNKVLMVSGSDMHGTPISVAAERQGVAPEKLARQFHNSHQRLFEELGLSLDLYTSTATDNHQQVVNDTFLHLQEKGYLIEKETEQFHCPKCKRFLPDRFVEGICPHCKAEGARGDQCDSCGYAVTSTELGNPVCKMCGGSPELRKTTHFFFDLPQFSKQLFSWVKQQEHWRNHVRQFTLGLLKEGLIARAVTRDLDYGIPVPVKGFEHKVVYVWFEAVIGYLSASIEWAKMSGKPEAWRDFWCDSDCHHYYFMGKDNILFHTIIWPAILMGYDKNLNLPYDVPANQYLNLAGEKFSKSKGIMITVSDLISTYDVNAVRFYFAKNMPENKDTNFSYEFFIEQNNGILVATIGNFIYRTLSFVDRFYGGEVPQGNLDKKVLNRINRAFTDVGEAIERCQFQRAIGEVISFAEFGNRYFNKQEPWRESKDKQRPTNTIYNCIQIVSALNTLFHPFLPRASDQLTKQLGERGIDSWKHVEIPVDRKLQDVKPLFQKLV